VRANKRSVDPPRSTMASSPYRRASTPLVIGQFHHSCRMMIPVCQLSVTKRYCCTLRFPEIQDGSEFSHARA
jgi:hypothetical protein